MKEIIQERYNEENNGVVIITFDDNTEMGLLLNGHKYPITEQHEEWLDAGNVPIKYDANYGKTKGQVATDVRVKKLKELEDRFELEANKSVKFGSFTFSGGKESGRLARDKSQMMVNTLVNLEVSTFNDIDKNPVTMSPQEMEDLGVTIGIAYEEEWQNNSRKQKAVMDCGDNITCINNVEW